MYRFYLCQPHAKCATTGWYLKLAPNDLDATIKLHRGVSVLYHQKFGINPHVQADENNKILYNPVRLAALWLSSVLRLQLAGDIILVNCHGGFMPFEGAIILETIESRKLIWPEQFDGEIITISRWPEGKHYYLCSNKQRIFVPDKYRTFEAAYEVALCYVPDERIK